MLHRCTKYNVLEEEGWQSPLHSLAYKVCPPGASHGGSGHWQWSGTLISAEICGNNYASLDALHSTTTRDVKTVRMRAMLEKEEMK